MHPLTVFGTLLCEQFLFVIGARSLKPELPRTRPQYRVSSPSSLEGEMGGQIVRGDNYTFACGVLRTESSIGDKQIYRFEHVYVGILVLVLIRVFPFIEEFVAVPATTEER